MGRGKIKDHGAPENRYFVCAPEGKTLILEDVTTTGGSLLEQIEKLEKLENVKIAGVISMLNRSEVRDDGKTIAEVLEDRNIQFYPLADIHEVLPIAVKKLKPSRNVLEKAWNYYKQYCRSQKVRLRLDDLLNIQ